MQDSGNIASDTWARGVAVVERLRAAGHQAWLVGGCVRDRLLGRPLKDIDIATGADPDAVQALFPRSVAVGKAFGVIKVITETGEVDVASLRADDRYIDGRRPVAVRPGTLAEDAARRDLTVNALYADPNGGITDPVGGLADLQARRLRGIGDAVARFTEDRLRVLRVLRFAAVLDFTIEDGTWRAACTVPIAGVSRERILDELGKALEAGAGGRFLRLCARAGVLDHITSGLAVEDTAEVLDRLGPSPRQLALAAWLHQLGPAGAAAWLDAQPTPAAWRRDLPWLIDLSARLSEQPLAARRRALRDPRREALMALTCAIDPYRTSTYLSWAETDPSPIPVNPKALLALGVAQGPELGACLRACEDAWLEGHWRTSDELPAQVAAWRTKTNAKT